MSIMQPTKDTIRRAAEAIRAGEVVVMPTETVYGLACDANNAEAVRKVFAMKQRPADNPFIVHIDGLHNLGMVASSWPGVCEILARRFWPGPLTVVLPKRATLPSVTTGGLNTVAVRVPNHPVALDLIREAGCPIAAPSANPFMGLSPTTADDVDPRIAEKAAMILDGGPCPIGLESTVLDLSGDNPQILRPGGLPRSLIQATIGVPLGQMPPPSVRKSPGLYRRHYAPNTPVVMIDSLTADQAGLTFEKPAGPHQTQMPRDPVGYAAGLYSALRRLDNGKHEAIYVARPPEGPEWEAVHDRLRKASAR